MASWTWKLRSAILKKTTEAVRICLESTPRVHVMPQLRISLYAAAPLVPSLRLQLVAGLPCSIRRGVPGQVASPLMYPP